MLELTNRRATIGASIKSRVKEVDGERLITMQVPVSFVVLPGEVAALLRNDRAPDRLFTRDKDGHHDMPALLGIRDLRMKDAVPSAEVTITVYARGKPITVHLSDATLGPIDLSPFGGGKTQCSLRVNAEPAFDAALLHLLAHTGSDCEIAIVAEGWNAQTELTLDDEIDEEFEEAGA